MKISKKVCTFCTNYNPMTSADAKNKNIFLGIVGMLQSGVFGFGVAFGRYQYIL